MEPPKLERSFGRTAFGADAANYHKARPPYPEETWAALRERAGLSSGIDILEIGAGTGLATAQLLAHEPRSLVAIEPDHRLADYLRAFLPDARLEVMATPFEDADLPASRFDLAVSATAFHWLDAPAALRRLHAMLCPEGTVALWWNVFGDPSRPDPFHEATHHLFEGHKTSPASGGAERKEHALDQEARLQDFAAAGFAADEPQFVRWTLRLDPLGVRDLYATYSNVNALPSEERARLLDGLTEIAARQFGGHVERNMVTAIYTARRAL